jgi:hypothetical protein
MRKKLQKNFNEKCFKMALSDSNRRLIKVNFGRFFTDLKSAEKIATLGRCYFFKKSASTFKSRTIVAQSFNLVTLPPLPRRRQQLLNKL